MADIKGWKGHCGIYQGHSGRYQGLEGALWQISRAGRSTVADIKGWKEISRAGRSTVADIKGWKEHCGRYQGLEGALWQISRAGRSTVADIKGHSTPSLNTYTGCRMLSIMCGCNYEPYLQILFCHLDQPLLHPQTGQSDQTSLTVTFSREGCG